MPLRNKEWGGEGIESQRGAHGPRPQLPSKAESSAMRDRGGTDPGRRLQAHKLGGRHGADYSFAFTVSLPLAVRAKRSGRYMSSTVAAG